MYIYHAVDPHILIIHSTCTQRPTPTAQNSVWAVGVDRNTDTTIILSYIAHAWCQLSQQ